jgi:hypothetical protein
MIHFPIENPRIPVISTPDFDSSINEVIPEPGVSMTFGHIDIYYWGPSVLKSLLKLWPEVRSSLPDIVYTMGNEPGPKFHKFVSLLGFRPILEAPCTDGKMRTIYCHIKARE